MTNNQLKLLDKDFSDWTKIPRDLEAAENKVKCALKHGLKVRWYYDDDKDFYEEMKMNPRKETQYLGLIIAKPDIEPRGQLCIPDCVLIVESYPCEKENPRCDWVSLSRLMDDERIVELFAAK